jgi:hypothetical protein
MADTPEQPPMTDSQILTHISELVQEEHDLEQGAALSEEQQERLRQLEISLDQCWDLLRQRRARREFGQNPDGAAPRDPKIVEHYKQ